VRYVLGFPEVTVALSSMHISAHLDSNRRALAAGPLPPEVMNELRHRHRWVRNFYQGRRYAKPNQT
jgi:aryl-alcohol dehydrogenase-like predicted oxidoreductase